MKCYTHQTVEAIAICRVCNRALCANCVAEVGGTCTCKNRCEERAAEFNAMISNRTIKVQPRIFSPLHGIIGIVLLFWGVWFRSNSSSLVLASIGGVFLVWSIIGYTFYRNKNDASNILTK